MMKPCPCCHFDAILAEPNRSYCPVCGYEQGVREPCPQQVALAKKILERFPKLKRSEFPFELDKRVPLVKRHEVIDWLNQLK